jgi:hypothetical protein
MSGQMSHEPAVACGSAATSGQVEREVHAGVHLVRGVARYIGQTQR